MQIKDFAALKINHSDYELLFLAKDYAPQSIASVKSRMNEMKAQFNSLETIKREKCTFFRFKTSDAQYHIFSTTGGYLQININKFKEIDKDHKDFLHMVKL